MERLDARNIGPLRKQLDITTIEIKNLFGRFNYKINLVEERKDLCIISAPNGFGKSTILEFIENFAKGNLSYFYEKEFSEILFYFSNEKICKIFKLRKEDQPNISFFEFERDIQTIRKNKLSMTIEYDGEKFEYKDRDSFRALKTIERNYPYLARIDENLWKDNRSGELLSKSELIFRYGDEFNRLYNNSDEIWFKRLISSIFVFSISTSRLKSEYSENFKRRKSNIIVEQIAENTRNKIRKAIHDQFEKGRELETSFPTRILDALRSKYPNCSLDTLVFLMSEVQGQEDRYGQLGIIPNSDTTQEISQRLDFLQKGDSSSGLTVLEIYLNDILTKFSLLNNLADRLELFRSSINDLFSFKKIEISADEGLIVKDEKTNSVIPLVSLSSGEQHLVVLLGQLIFDTEENALVLIDEPEISFHPAWQRVFLEIIEEISKINKLKFIVATHSYTLIDDRWDNVIDLSEQYETVMW